MVRALAFLAIASTLGLAADVCLAQVDGKDLKAAYIFNFALFTTWPDANAKAPLVVCASPDNPLWPGLHALNGKPVNGRLWTMTDIAHPKAPHCDIAVLARGAQHPAATAGVLVVRDGAGGNAAITLVEDDEHIRFDIDTQEAARCGLRISSHLLRLARNVL
ncbi:YfiR family protein [Massilia rhizosphaerae]|uniref:YfiR family protein n=1 Tax=Massilia rhizosphaerae TaxID=2784389 RepID=UPI0018DDBDAE|nr:YfiR family protein [Massilia rhizosphaerae]